MSKKKLTTAKRLKNAENVGYHRGFRDMLSWLISEYAFDEGFVSWLIEQDFKNRERDDD